MPPARRAVSGVLVAACFPSLLSLACSSLPPLVLRVHLTKKWKLTKQKRATGSCVSNGRLSFPHNMVFQIFLSIACYFDFDFPVNFPARNSSTRGNPRSATDAWPSLGRRIVPVTAPPKLTAVAALIKLRLCVLDSCASVISRRRLKHDLGPSGVTGIEMLVGIRRTR